MNKRKANLRLTILGGLFCLACIVFSIRLIDLQIVRRSRFRPATASTTLTRESAITAQRGDICDRNGVVLVTNEYTHDLVIDYFSLPGTVKEENEMLINLYRTCIAGGAEPILCENYPLTGTYPEMSFVPGSEQTVSAIIDHYNLKKGSSAKGIAKYLADRYDLLNSDGSLIYSSEETLIIMHLRWSMLAADFYNLGTYTLAVDIPREVMVSVSESSVRGALVSTVATRHYNYPGCASHILGQVGSIFAEDWEEYKAKGYSMDAKVGISGCEKLFEDYLRGQDGVLVTVYDKQGNVIDSYVKKEPVAGSDVWLTLDIELQQTAEAALPENIAYAVSHATGTHTGEDASAAAFVMVEVDTGQVLAMASYPTYDLTTFNEDYESLKQAEVSPLLNRAINGLYAPGSTFKPGVAVAALDEGVITTSTIINTTGRYTYFKDYQPRCWYYISTGRSHGAINVHEALRVSCNCFFYEVGRLLGIERLNAYSRLFGLGEPTGFELGGEVGILAGPDYRNASGLEAWKETDTIVAAIGQSENLFSPLQLAMYFSALGNGGTRYAATLLYGVREFYTDEELVAPKQPQVLSTFKLSASDHAVLLDSLRAVVSTSVSLTSFCRGVSVKVGGKTGTAQVGETKSENGLFAALAPIDDPKVAAVCVVEQGHAGTYSGYTVGKVFAKYFE